MLRGKGKTPISFILFQFVEVQHCHPAKLVQSGKATHMQTS